MKKIAIYPVTKKNKDIVDCFISKNLGEGDFYAIVPSGYKNEVLFHSDINVLHHLSEAYGHVDEIVFLEMQNIDRLFSEVSLSLKKGIKTVLIQEISGDNKTIFQKIAIENNAEIVFLAESDIVGRIENRSDVFTPQESIIIAVGSLTKGICTSSIVALLYRILSENGYHVGIVSSDCNLQLLRAEMLPIRDFITNNLDYTVMRINRFMNFYQLRNHSDIIILQLPDEGLYRVSNEFETCYGAETYLISQAVDFDYCVMASPYIGDDNLTYETLSNISEHRYGFKFDCIIVTQNIIDMGVAQGTTKMNYYIASKEDVDNAVASMENIQTQMLFTSDDSNWAKRVMDDMVYKLSGN